MEGTREEGHYQCKRMLFRFHDRVQLERPELDPGRLDAPQFQIGSVSQIPENDKNGNENVLGVLQRADNAYYRTSRYQGHFGAISRNFADVRRHEAGGDNHDARMVRNQPGTPLRNSRSSSHQLAQKRLRRIGFGAARAQFSKHGKRGDDQSSRGSYERSDTLVLVLRL